MRKEEFDKVLKSLFEMTRETIQHDGHIVILGSQAIIAHLDPNFFPELEDVYLSMEVDVAAMGLTEEQQSTIGNFIFKNIGENSLYDQTYGVHVDGIEIPDPGMPRGWEKRLVSVKIPGVPDDLYKAISVEDLVASKLYAGREKDYAYVQDLIKSKHTSLSKVKDVLDELPSNAKTELAKRLWSERYLPQIYPAANRHSKPNI